jgi:hypothetical protein
MNSIDIIGMEGAMLKWDTNKIQNAQKTQKERIYQY